MSVSERHFIILIIEILDLFVSFYNASYAQLRGYLLKCVVPSKNVFQSVVAKKVCCPIKILIPTVSNQSSKVKLMKSRSFMPGFLRRHNLSFIWSKFSSLLFWASPNLYFRHSLLDHMRCKLEDLLSNLQISEESFSWFGISSTSATRNLGSFSGPKKAFYSTRF